MSAPQPKKYFDYSPKPASTLESLATQVEELQAEVHKLHVWQGGLALALVLALAF